MPGEIRDSGDLQELGNVEQQDEISDIDTAIDKLMEDDNLPEEISFYESADKEDQTSEIRVYYDDDGKEYRIGDNLIPNNHYRVEGYDYVTDDKGRIMSAEGTLHIKDREGRRPMPDPIEVIGKGDELKTDDRGHLIGDQFDGSNGMENMIPQDADINRGAYKNFENQLAREVKSGKNVFVKVEPMYDGVSWRPGAIVVSYSIDGKENIRLFPNNR